jgi:hypothetical protein
MALEGDDDRPRITKEAAHLGTGLEAREAIQVTKFLEFCHRGIMTTFFLEEKKTFSGNFAAQAAFRAKSYPLKNAKSHKN